MAKSFTISGTGCSLVDYLYSPIDFKGEIFRRFLSQSPGDGGLSPGKLVFTEEFEKYSNSSYAAARQYLTAGMEPVGINIGGPSIVSLIHAAQMLHNTPARVHFFGCKGRDDAGRFIEEKLTQTPMKTGYYKTSERFTPFTDVLSDPEYDHGHGERIFINNIGAAWDFLPSDLDESFFSSDMVVFGGTALVPNIHSSLTQLLAKAKQQNAITIVNTVYDFLSEKSDPQKPWQLGENNDAYPYIDLLITDKEEALRHSGRETIKEALTYFKDQGVGAAIITHGPMPVSFFAQSQIWEKDAPDEMPVSQLTINQIKENPERAGDTTGCGDNFTGGVIASIAQQKLDHPSKKINMRKAIAMGVASGGFACFYHGGTWLEKTPGEKAGKINLYLNDYYEQTRLKS